RHGSLSTAVRPAAGLLIGQVVGGHSDVCIEPRHTLVIGATGSGKTVTLRRLMQEATRTMGVVAVDGKGDPELASDLQRFAELAGRRFVAWSPRLSSVYNPFSHGSETEIVDKALAAESWGDDYYLRLGQRFLGFAVRALLAARREPTVAALARYADPDNLEELAPAMELASPGAWNALVGSLPRVGAAERQAIAGTQHRLAIMAESDVGSLLEPGEGRQRVDLLDAVRGGHVVYFDLNADTRPHLARMLGAAIVMDLVSVAATLQHDRDRRPTALLFDDVQAFATKAATTGLASLFARGRSAGMMLLVGTQSLADLDGGERRGSMEQLLDNRGALIVHRLPGRNSADRASRELGDRQCQNLSEHLEGGPGRWQPRGSATRTASREPHILSAELAELPTGVAVVGTAGRPPQYVRVLAPDGGN
ncbi:MAG: type IV secretory system conjugative DNA transfer family protein, partial [Solirubrobacteraceae bacterium]